MPAGTTLRGMKRIRGDTLESAMLNHQKLRNTKRMPRKTTAQCPACAELGRDRRGEHLVVFEDGKFGCVAFPGDSEHRKQIWKLVGMRDANHSSLPANLIKFKRSYQLRRDLALTP